MGSLEKWIDAWHEVMMQMMTPFIDQSMRVFGYNSGWLNGFYAGWLDGYKFGKNDDIDASDSFP